MTGNIDSEMLRHLIGNPGSTFTFSSPTKAGEARYGATPYPYSSRYNKAVFGLHLAPADTQCK